MNILYCGDRGIADGLLISILSLMRQVEEPLYIYIMTLSLREGPRPVAPLKEETVKTLDSLVRQRNGGFVRLIDCSDLFSRELPKANMQTRFTPGCMLRLYADLLPELPERILYLDNDVVCRKPFREFYEMDLEGAEVAGVLDHYGKWFFRRNPFKLDYVNSGVLLMDLKRIRETNLFGRCRERCAQKKMFMPDQSALNKLCACKRLMPRRYNEQRKLKPDTVFQHFTTSFRFFPLPKAVTVKPWQIERMHSILKLHEYDGLLEEFVSLQPLLLTEREEPIP